MNPTGICYQAYIPMRKEPDETSEMVNQVLFGESFSILDENKTKNFSLICLLHDKYEGWVNSSCIYFPSDQEWKELNKLTIVPSHELINLLHSDDKKSNLIVGCGSILRISTNGKTRIGKTEFNVQMNSDGPPENRERLIYYGLKLLTIPYLWGGRSSFGFDCSGLCQNLYRQIGMGIPRDAADQAGLGNTISFIEESLPGDLAFFDNEEGRIIHVGMILEKNKILHASGVVKIDKIDHQGIFSKEQNRYTHKLRLIKRLI